MVFYWLDGCYSGVIDVELALTWLNGCCIDDLDVVEVLYWCCSCVKVVLKWFILIIVHFNTTTTPLQHSFHRYNTTTTLSEL